MRFFTLLLLCLSLAFSASKSPFIVLQTSFGNIEIVLNPKVAPKAVENFLGHINSGYYNKGVFHRIIKGFMIQGGDPLGTGYGGESIWGKGFGIEVSRELRFNKPGLLAMARTSRPNSQGSQFFITTAATPHLNGQYTIFGEVKAKSMKVVRFIENSPVRGDKPLNKPEIIKAWVEVNGK